MRNGYNGARRPPVVFVRDGDARVVVRREGYDDLLRSGRLGRPLRPRGVCGGARPALIEGGGAAVRGAVVSSVYAALRV